MCIKNPEVGHCHAFLIILSCTNLQKVVCSILQSLCNLGVYSLVDDNVVDKS